MKNDLYKVVFAFAVCLILFACNSENKVENEQQTKENTDKDTVSILTAFISKQELSIQTFEINTSKQQTIQGKQGTVIYFPMDCFGKMQGKVKIELIECYSIQDMLLNGLSTETTDGNLLETDGMIYLNALNEKGDTLKIKQGKVKVKMPTKQEKHGIKYFEGVENNNTIIWNLSNEKLKVEYSITSINTTESKSNPQVTNPQVTNPENDTIRQAQHKTGQSQIVIDKKIKNENLVNYVFSISKMGWQNCDRFIEGETKQLTVNVPKESTGASYYLVLKNYNSSALPRQTTDGKLSFIIPINEPYTIVALSSKGEDIYFNMMDYTGGKYEVNFTELKPVTRQELTDLLMKKFGKDIWNRPLS
jgi:hypothetical protein